VCSNCDGHPPCTVGQEEDRGEAKASADVVSHEAEANADVVHVDEAIDELDVGTDDEEFRLEIKILAIRDF
jgi:hypothetical protein